MSPIAVSNDFLVAPAAYDAAVRYNPRERWLLRDEQHRFDALRLLRQVPANHPSWLSSRRPVCTENLIRIDCVTESPKRQRR
jgi:hypothetical protein